MKYDIEIDKETWAFIQKTESFYNNEILFPTPEQQRFEYNRMCRAFSENEKYRLKIY